MRDPLNVVHGGCDSDEPWNQNVADCMNEITLASSLFVYVFSLRKGCNSTQ